MNHEYQIISMRSVVILVFSIIALASGYIYLSHKQSLSAVYYPMEKKYQKEDLSQQCSYQKFASLIQCFRKDFYQGLRTGNSYEQHHLYLLATGLYERSLVLERSKEKLLAIHIEYLEQTYTFTQLTKNAVVSRKNLQILSRYLTDYKKEEVLKRIYTTKQIIEKVESDFTQQLTGNDELDNRFSLVKKRLFDTYSTLKPITDLAHD